MRVCVDAWRSHVGEAFTGWRHWSLEIYCLMGEDDVRMVTADARSLRTNTALLIDRFLRPCGPSSIVYGAVKTAFV